MMYCPKCGKEVPDDSDFCRYCGADLRSMKESQNNAIDTDSDVSGSETGNDASTEDKDLIPVEQKEGTAGPGTDASESGENPESYARKQSVRQLSERKNNSKLVIVIVICAVVIAILLVVIVGQNRKAPEPRNEKPQTSESAKPTAAASTKEPENTAKADKKTQSDMTIKQLSDYQAINDEISAEATTMSDKVKANSESLTATIDENYDNMKANQQAITDFYTTTLSDSKLLYNNINEYCKMSYHLMISNGDINSYQKWTDAMSDLYKAWNDEMSDYYKAWNRSMEDVYKSWNRACNNAPDGTDYDERSDLWDAKYKEYEDSWDNLYNQYEDAWEALYDQYEDVYEDFGDEETDIDKDLKASIAE